MISYKDMTFCESDCANEDCERRLTPKVIEDARLWWYNDPDNAPISITDFSHACPEYKA